MKKKTKLIATIASLCVALTLMVFGVYAASTITLNVTSNVTFNAQSVYVGYKAKVERSTTSAFTAGENTTTLVAEQTDWVNNYTGALGSQTSEDSLTAWTPTGIAFEEGKQFIKYTITFKNDSSFAIQVTVSNEPASAQGITVTSSGNIDSIAAGATGAYTLTLELTNLNASITNFTVSPAFTISTATNVNT